MTNEIAKTENTNVAKYDSKQIQLIHDLYAKDTTKEEFELYLYTANKFGLDPLLKQIWCVKFKNEKAQIYAGRDGFLEVAHRSGQFNGIKSGMKDERTAFAEVYRKDMENPFYVEVDMAEYSTGMALWKSKPKTMLIKVAESQALRKAFSISGIYSPEEMGQWECDVQGIKFNPVVPQITTTANTTNTAGNNPNGFDWSKLNLNSKPKWEFDKNKKPIVPKMIKRLFAINNKTYKLSDDDFKALCKEVTGKEHSYEWTYGDIKAIEEALAESVEYDEPIEAEIEESPTEEEMAYLQEKLNAEEV